MGNEREKQEVYGNFSTTKICRNEESQGSNKMT